MRPFVDILGASGSVYRFRLIGDPNQLPAAAGNFLFMSPLGGDDEVVCCGTARRLRGVAPYWRTAVAGRQADAIYVRLNVSHFFRAMENEDIVAGQRPASVLDELDDNSNA
jgi:hypothetical protein